MDLVDIDSYMLHLVIVYIAIGFIEIVSLHNSSMPSNWSFWIFCIEIIKTKHYLASYPNETQYKK